MNAAQRINQDSRNPERYTPPAIIAAARATLGSIELDPASCAAANRFVQAQRYYTKQDDALRHTWQAATVWMNHPFSRGEQPCKRHCQKHICRTRGHHITEELPSNEAWIGKLIHHYHTGDIKQACCICFAATSETWFTPLFDFWRCYLTPRTNYIDAHGNPARGAPKGSVVTYLGPNVERFIENFITLGNIEPPAIRKQAR